MQSLSSTAAALAAAGILLVANLQAQQAPAQKAPPSSTSKTQPASGAKAAGGAAADHGSAPALLTDKDKLSYAIGMNIGTSLHQQSANVDVDPKILARGISDALAGGKLLLTQDQAKAAIDKLQEKMQIAQGEKLQAAAQANKKEGEAFLAANRTKDGVMALPSGLQYKVLQPGTGPKPALTDTVVCNFKGTFINGKVFDSSYESGQPVTFPVNRVIKGFTEALQLMPVGSKWQIVLPPDLAYGESGAGEDIGPNSTIILEVELLSIQAPGAKTPGQPAGPSDQPAGPGDQPAGPGQNGPGSPNNGAAGPN
jgi:FKBP-type peptidyl-prolyl cis-trans isomerase